MANALATKILIQYGTRLGFTYMYRVLLYTPLVVSATTNFLCSSRKMVMLMMLIVMHIVMVILMLMLLY